MPKAAVLIEVGDPLRIVDVTLDPPKAGEARVRILATGVCHSDLSIQRGVLPAPLPMVLGHEATGVVEELGDGVEDLRPGDRVILSCVPQCGTCFSCRHGRPELCDLAAMGAATGGLFDGTPRFCLDGQPVHQWVCTGTFADATVVQARGLVKIDADVPADVAALVSCAVATGFGAATNTADIRPGHTVAVIGCGGVGLNVIQGARAAGAERIIAVDVVDAKLDFARPFGATDTVNASTGDPVAAVLELTAQRGADVAFEVVGSAATTEQTLRMTGRGGQAVFVGGPPIETMLQLPVVELIATEKQILGSAYGGTDIQRDLPALVRRYQEGELLLDELVSRRIALAQVNEAFDAMARGEVARSVIVWE